jgi:alkylresorcinol/alkylpyrone synthase
VIQAHPALLGVARALPPHVCTQEDMLGFAVSHLERFGVSPALLERFSRNTRVRQRHLALPLAEYGARRTFAATNEIWTRVSLDLCERAARSALEAAGVGPGDVDQVFFVSTTGIATPSLDARLANRIGLPARILRTPIFGLGCAGGAAGVARAAEALRARPDQLALLVAVELCSLTLQHDDFSVANLIAAALFGDACAAVVLAGAARAAGAAGPRVRDSASVFFPDTEEIMGWDVRDGGLGVMLTADVPEVARHLVPPHVDRFLEAHGFARAHVDRWVFHSGGPRVLDAFEEGLALPPRALDLSRRCLEDVGNVSSVSVLLALEDHWREAPPRGGRLAALLALGPGFSAEMSLLDW